MRAAIARRVERLEAVQTPKLSITRGWKRPLTSSTLAACFWSFSISPHCKNSGVQCTPNHLHTYGVLTHLSLMVCNTHQIFGVLTHLLLKVCNTHQILGLLTHTVTEGVHYTPNIWCAKHTLSLKVCITHQTFSVLTHCVTEGVHYTPSVLNTPCH